MFRVLGIKGVIPGVDPATYEFLKNTPIVVVADNGLMKDQKVFIATSRKATADAGKFEIRSLKDVKDEGLEYVIVDASKNGTAAFAKLEEWKETWDATTADSDGPSKADVLIPPEGSPPVDVTVVVTGSDGSTDVGSGGDNGAAVYP